METKIVTIFGKQLFALALVTILAVSGVTISVSSVEAGPGTNLTNQHGCEGGR